jgi:hypothetical protein
MVESSFSYIIPAGFRTRAGCRITPAGQAVTYASMLDS